MQIYTCDFGRFLVIMLRSVGFSAPMTYTSFSFPLFCTMTLYDEGYYAIIIIIIIIIMHVGLKSSCEVMFCTNFK